MKILKRKKTKNACEEREKGESESCENLSDVEISELRERKIYLDTTNLGLNQGFGFEVTMNYVRTSCEVDQKPIYLREDKTNCVSSYSLASNQNLGSEVLLYLKGL